MRARFMLPPAMHMRPRGEAPGRSGREAARGHARDVAALVLAGAVAACSGQQQRVRDDAEVPRAAVQAQRERIHALWAERSPGGVPPDVCLGPGDLLEITVLRWDEMQNFRARVAPDGAIALPVVGRVPVAGLTEEQLRDRLTQRLGATVMREPHVSIFIAERASQQVSVTGAVARPGLFGLSRQNRTVQDLLSEAGGLNHDSGGTVLFYPADGSVCPGADGRERQRTVHAGPPKNVVPIEIDLNEQYEPPTENPMHLPVVGGDAVVVNRGRFLVDGWVRTPGAYDLTPGMTAFGGLTAAGGAMYPADLENVVVWRTEPGGTKRQIAVDVGAIQSGATRDVTIQAGDVIVVPASSIKLVPYSGYWVLTNVVRVGAGLSLTGF